MNSFPNKILLATDGSEDATLAARAAIELSNRTASELHVVHVWHDVPTPHFHSFVKAQLRQEAEEVLRKQLERIESRQGEPLRRPTSGKGGPSRRSSTSARSWRSGS